MVATYSGGASGDMKIYVDGVESGTGTGPSDILGIPVGDVNGQCRLGSDYAGSADNFAGNMCDFAVWTAELSAADVSEIL